MNKIQAMPETKWTIDPAHSEIGFKVKHLMISYVKGSFRSFDANIYTGDDNFNTAEVEFWMNPASIYTGDDKRDENLLGPEFFDVEKFKQISFKGTYRRSYTADSELWGDLTIKGITQRVMLKVKFGGVMRDPSGNIKAGFTLKGRLNRKDWGLVWNKAIEEGGVFLGDEVLINCHVELMRTPAKSKVRSEVEELEDEGVAAEE